MNAPAEKAHTVMLEGNDAQLHLFEDFEDVLS